MRSRLKRHACLLHVAITLTLIPGVLLIDIIGPLARVPGSEVVRSNEERLAMAIVRPVQAFAGLFGDAVWANHAGRWPASWPFGASVQLQLMRYGVPFWYVVLAVITEAAAAANRLWRRSRRLPTAG